MNKSYSNRKKQILEAFEPAREAKRNSISKIAKLGQGRGVGKYLLFFVLVIYILFYNLFMHMIMGFQMHKKTAKTIAIIMAFILPSLTIFNIMGESVKAASEYVDVITPDLGGKVVHAALYYRNTFLNYELDLVCDGRTYTIYSGNKEVNGYADNNYVITTEDPSVNINEQYSYITENKTLDFTEIADSGFYKIVGGSNLTDVITVTVKRKSDCITKYISYDQFGAVPGLSSDGSYEKSFSELGLDGSNHRILGYTGNYYYNSNHIAIGTANISILSEKIKLVYHGHGAGPGTYGWDKSGLWIAYQNGSESEQIETYDISAGTTRSFYVRNSDEITITAPDGISVTNPHSIVSNDSVKESVIDISTHTHIWNYELSEDCHTITATCIAETECNITETPSITIQATDMEYSAELYNGLSIIDELTSVIGAEYTIEYTTTGSEPPIAAGNYTVNLTVEDTTATYDFQITKAPLSIIVKDQVIIRDGILDDGIDSIETMGLKGTDSIESVELAVDNNDVTDNGRITVSEIIIIGATDYASENYEITYVDGNLVVEKRLPVIFDIPYGSPITYGDFLSDSELIGGIADVPGKFEWKQDNIQPTVDNSNCTPYEIIFIPEDLNNYYTVEIYTTVSVNPAILEVEWLNDLFTYNGKSHVPDGKLKGVHENDVVNLTIAGEKIDASDTPYFAYAYIDNHNYIISEETISKEFVILPKEITREMVKLSKKDGIYYFSGENIAPGVIVKDGKTTLSGNDYILGGDLSAVSYGTHILKVVGTGNYTGNVDVEWSIDDKNSPTGMIKITDKVWEAYNDFISYDTYYNNGQTVTITAYDGDNESGIDKIYYMISKQRLLGCDLVGTPTFIWNEIENGGEFQVIQDDYFVIYARIVDKAGNETFISSEGIVLDSKSPLIIGVKSDEKYCESQTVKITDNNLAYVTYNGKVIDLYDDCYTLPANGKLATLIAYDKAGNTTKIKDFTVYNGHSFTHYVNNNDATETRNATETAYCDHGCGTIDEREIPDSKIVKKKGNIKIIANVDENVPGISFNNLDKKLVVSLLKKSEKEQYKTGSDVNLIVNVETIDGGKQFMADKQIIADCLKEIESLNKTAVMLDITLYKQVKTAGKEPKLMQITDTKGHNISISFELPKKIMENSSNKSFQIIRVHDGVATVLPTEFDEETHIITFETDKFSTYAIAYDEETDINWQDVPAGDLFDPKEWIIALLISLGVIIEIITTGKPVKVH